MRTNAKSVQTTDDSVIHDLPPASLVDRFDREGANQVNYKYEGIARAGDNLNKTTEQLEQERYQATMELYLRSPEGIGVMAAKHAREAALDHIMLQQSRIQSANELIAGAILGAMKGIEVATASPVTSYWYRGEYVTTIKTWTKRGHPFHGKFVITGELGSGYTPSVSFKWGWGRISHISSVNPKDDEWLNVFARDLQRWVLARRHSWGH